jgi:hypothetical protein
MKTNASLGDLAGLCKLFGGLKGKNMLEEFGGNCVAVAAGFAGPEGMLA